MHSDSSVFSPVGTVITASMVPHHRDSIINKQTNTLLWRKTHTHYNMPEPQWSWRWCWQWQHLAVMPYSEQTLTKRPAWTMQRRAGGRCSVSCPRNLTARCQQEMKMTRLSQLVLVRESDPKYFQWDQFHIIIWRVKKTQISFTNNTNSGTPRW